MNKQEIKTYNEQLSLLNNNDNETKIALIQEIYNYISGYNDLEAAELSNDIVVLFLRNTEQINESVDIVKDVKQQLIEAFDNISVIANENTTSGELKTFYFLNKLYSCYKSSISPVYTEQDKKDFTKLLENLEKIKVIFGLTDDSKKEYFPISSLLYNIIVNDKLKDKLNNSETIQTLFLALQIYKSNPELKEYENINTLLKKLNLKFIDYLIEDGVRRIGGNNWKSNYEKNGTLVLYSTKNNKVLIRNINKKYFNEINTFKNEYKMSDIQSEKNNNNDDIAYYVEYQNSSDLDFINIAKKIEQAKKEVILDILKLIFDQGYYNILFDEALFSTNNKISLINPFCNKDKFVILNSNGNINTREDCLTAVSEWLEQFGLFVLAGNGIDVINLGTLVSLEKIRQVCIKELNLNDENINFNVLLNNWLDNVKEDKRDAFNKFFERYKAELKYINTTSELFNKTYDREFFIPYHIDKKILEKLDFDKRIEKKKICKVKCEENLFSGTKTIKDTSGNNDYSNYKKEYSEEFDRDKTDEIEVAVDEQNKKIYFDDDISLYKNFSESIENLNSHTLPIDLKLSNADVDDIVRMMELFKDAINEIHGEKIPLKDISIYRIVHHLLLIKMTKVKVEDWMELLRYHQIIGYNRIIEKLPFDGENGVLYVPKDPSRACSTYNSLFRKYLYSYVKRNDIDIYDQEISCKNGYLVKGNRIKKIVFLFDLTQNGSATINVLKYHLDNNNAKLLPPSLKSNVNNNQFIQFNVNGKKLHISDIIKTNNPAIYCHFIYAGQTGIDNVKSFAESFVKKEYPNLKFEIMDPIKKLDDNKKWDIEKENLCESIYGTGKFKSTLNVDDYPVIREFNQPKHNIMSEELMDIEKVVAIFCKRPEKII